jgi:hypothetical protein
MNEKELCCDEEHTWWARAPVFYDACFLLNNADPLFKILVDRLPRWGIDVSHCTFNAESTFCIVFTLEGSRLDDELYGTGFEYR